MTDLETALTRLAADLDFPPTPSVAPRVCARLEADGARPAWRLGRLRVALLVVLAVLVPAGAVLAASPSARNAVLELFQLRGATIERVRTLPEVPAEGAPDLGERVTLAEARRYVDFAIPLPTALGPPDRVYVEPRGPGGMVHLVWNPTSRLRRAPATGVGLLLTMGRGSLDERLFGKQIATGTRIEPVEVEGHDGYFLSGGQHVVFFLDAHGEFTSDALRLAGRTLVFERPPLVARLEAELPRDEAVRIAGSLRPPR